jgi:hypothetical protein
MSDPAYEVVYNVGLLDDIHNYFPALLYDQGRFQNLPTLFSYVRTQMNSRFNLMSYGASLAAARAPTPAPTPAPAPDRRTVRQTAAEDILESIVSANMLLNLINPRTTRNDFVAASRLPRGADAWAAFRDPVVVAPSETVLAANTQVVQGTEIPSNTVCNICQDTILATDSCRRLTPCQHVYHRTCIDQWFTRSVFCPSCRHDIRVSSPRLEAAPSPSAALPEL